MNHYKAPLEEHKFEKLVKNYGYNIISSSKHYQIVDSNNDFLMEFAISHKKQGKREVKPIYTKLFLNKIKQTKE